MMKNEIILFKHDKFGEIGVIFEDGNPLFPATECAKILGYKNPNDAIIRHCRYLVKHEVPHPQNANKTMEKTFVPEGDLYRLIMRSKLPEAVEFESWVCDRILPSLRKHGAYFTAETLHKTMSDPRELAKLLTTLADEQAPQTRGRKRFSFGKGELLRPHFEQQERSSRDADRERLWHERYSVQQNASRLRDTVFHQKILGALRGICEPRLYAEQDLRD